jgi:YesN/AraC family two-component response regulator
MDNTIVEYINSHRIEIAKKLLLEQNYTVSKIAEAAGYNNTVTFTRNFKHYVGLSPSEYRSMNS